MKVVRSFKQVLVWSTCCTAVRLPAWLSYACFLIKEGVHVPALLVWKSLDLWLHLQSRAVRVLWMKCFIEASVAYQESDGCAGLSICTLH